jgi:hypothetical protein
VRIWPPVTLASNVGESPPPFQRAFQIPHSIRDGSVHDVDDLSTLSPHVYDHRPDGTDAKGSLVRRLASAARIEGGPVQYHLTAFQLYDAGFELLCVGVFQEELFGHFSTSAHYVLQASLVSASARHFAALSPSASWWTWPEV